MQERSGALGRPDGQRLDVEAAPREQAGDAREHAGLVLDEHRERVVGVLAARHQTPSSTQELSSSIQAASIMSADAAPAGTIG